MPKKSKKQSKPFEPSEFIPVNQDRLLVLRDTSVAISRSSAKRLAIAAQFLGLSDADELAQIVVNAFLEMYDEDHYITFPIMFQQVDTMQ